MDVHSCHRKFMEYNPFDGKHQIYVCSILDGLWEKISTRDRESLSQKIPVITPTIILSLRHS